MCYLSAVTICSSNRYLCVSFFISRSLLFAVPFRTISMPLLYVTLRYVTFRIPSHSIPFRSLSPFHCRSIFSILTVALRRAPSCSLPAVTFHPLFRSVFFSRFVCHLQVKALWGGHTSGSEGETGSLAGKRRTEEGQWSKLRGRRGRQLRS